MSPDVGLLMTRVALLIILGALVSMWWAPRPSPEFTVSLLSLAIGVLILIAVAIFARLGKK
ncbi:MAG: hypothetical protein GXO36_02655 [Chloroflexi bacterium]|nr:hypothetical protein [Chloroflexota bacterium]